LDKIFCGGSNMTSFKKRFRIFATLVAMMLVTIMMSMGIYAAQQIKATTSGSVALASSGDVLASVKIIKSQTGEAEATVVDNTYDRSFQEGAATYDETYALGDIVFAKVTDYVDYKITVTNNFDTTTKVNLTVNWRTMNVPEPLKLELLNESGTGALTLGSAIAIEKGASATVIVRVSLDQAKVTAVQKENGFQKTDYSFEIIVEKGSTQTNS